MDENQTSPAKASWEAVLDKALSVLLKKNQGVSPQEMARLMVEYVASPSFWTDNMKTDMTQIVLPSVQAWFDKKVATKFPA